MSKFYREIYKLKNLIRKGWIGRGVASESCRQESDAEHSFSMSLLALEIISKEKLELNQEKVLKMILYHELCEIDAGDHVPNEISSKEKYDLEKTGIERLANEYNMPEISNIWQEFEEGKTKEAKFVKMIDKLDAVMQSKIYAEENDKPELYEEFFNNAIEKIKDYINYLE